MPGVSRALVRFRWNTFYVREATRDAARLPGGPDGDRRLRRIRRRQPLLRGHRRVHASPAARTARGWSRGRRSTASRGWSSTTRCSGSSRTRRSIRSRSRACSTSTSAASAPGDSIRDAFGDLEPINPAYREPEARIKLMDAQRLAGLLPVPDARRRRRGGVVARPGRAARRVPRVQRVDARRLDVQLRGPHLRGAVHLPAGSRTRGDRRSTGRSTTARTSSSCARVRCAGPGFGRSPGDAVYDPMWARLAEAGILAAYHSGDAGYGRYADEWGSGGDFQAFRNDPFRTVTGGHRPIYDTIAALVCHGVFTRHPNLRVATIESGSDWVPLLLRALKKSYGQVPAGVRRQRSGAAAARSRLGLALLRGRPRPAPRRARREPDDLRLRLPARRGPRRSARRSSTTSPASPTTRSAS